MIKNENDDIIMNPKPNAKFQQIFFNAMTFSFPTPTKSSKSSVIFLFYRLRFRLLSHATICLLIFIYALKC